MRLLLSIIFLSIALFGKIVVATGVGRTVDSARKDALRQAVEQVVGAKIASKTVVRNGRLDMDHILSTTNGLVKSYKELDRFKDNDGSYKITLKVDISNDTSKQSIDNYIKDRKSMRAFNSSNFKDRSVLVLYSARGRNVLKKSSFAVEALLNSIQDELRDKSFDVILQDDLPGMSKIKTEESIMDEETAINYARMAKADAVVLATINTGIQKTQDGYDLVYANLLLKAYDTTSKRLIANVSKRGKTITQGGSFGIEDGEARAAEKVSKYAVKSLIRKIVQRLSTGARDFIIVEFINTDMKTQDKVLDILENEGYEFKIEKQYNNVMKIKINTDKTATSLRRIFTKIFEKNNMKLETKRVEGSYIEFSMQE